MANKFFVDDVLTAANDTIDKIKEDYYKEKAEILAPYLKPRKKYWLLGPLVTRSEDEAIIAANDNFNDRWSLSSVVYNATKQVKAINKVISLTKVIKKNSQTHVNLTTEEFDLIADKWKGR